MRWWWLLAIAVVSVPLLWPLPTTSRWDIVEDTALAAGKAAYLDSLLAAPRTAAPNVLLLLADDLGKFDVSAYGGPPGSTPSIDALAQRGVRFDAAYTTAPICAPSRAALLTGRYQNRFGFESQPMQRYVRNRGEYLGFRYIVDTDAMRPFLLDAYPDAAQRTQQGLPASEVSLAEVFAARGYATGIIGKWHLGYAPHNHPHAFGFQFQYGFMEAFTLYADESDPQVVNHHHPLFWEEHIWDMQRGGPSAITRQGATVAEPRYLTDALVAETKLFIDGALQQDRPFFAYVPFSAPHTPFQARRADFEAIEGARDHNQQVYLAMIRRLDWAVGELLAHLEARGVAGDTIVVFTSDNGGAAYTGATDNGPLRGGKFTQFGGGLQVPLLVRWDREAPRRVRRPVLLTDLFATLLNVLGVAAPQDRAYDSQDLLAESADRQRPLFWRSDFNRAVLQDQWKLLHDTRDDTVLLFDGRADPGERRNLAAEHPERVQALRGLLDDWERDLQAPRWPRVMNYRYEDALGTHWFAI